MKKTNSLALWLGLMASTGAIAQQDTNSARMDKLEGVYFGADVSFANETELTVNSVSITEDGDSAFNITIGYDSPVNNNFVVGLEAEYRDLGETEYVDVLKVDGTGFSINIKPKYYATSSPVYVGAVIGLGSYDLTATDMSSNESAEETELGFQFGLEIGYEFENVVLSGGYRSVGFDDIDGVDVVHSGLNAGVEFKF